MEYCTHCWCKTPKQIVHWHFRVSRQNHTTTCLTAAYMIWLPLIFFRFVLCTLGMGVSLKKYKGIKTSSLRVLTLFKDLFHYCVTHKKSHYCKIFNFACLRRRGFWHFEEITTFIKICVWTFYVIILHKMLPLKNVPQIFAELCCIHMDSKI